METMLEGFVGVDFFFFFCLHILPHCLILLHILMKRARGEERSKSLIFVLFLSLFATMDFWFEGTLEGLRLGMYLEVRETKEFCEQIEECKNERLQVCNGLKES